MVVFKAVGSLQAWNSTKCGSLSIFSLFSLLRTVSISFLFSYKKNIFKLSKIRPFRVFSDREHKFLCIVNELWLKRCFPSEHDAVIYIVYLLTFPFGTLKKSLTFSEHYDTFQLDGINTTRSPIRTSNISSGFGRLETEAAALTTAKSFYFSFFTSSSLHLRVPKTNFQFKFSLMNWPHYSVSWKWARSMAGLDVSVCAFAYRACAHKIFKYIWWMGIQKVQM